VNENDLYEQIKHAMQKAIEKKLIEPVVLKWMGTDGDLLYTDFQMLYANRPVSNIPMYPGRGFTQADASIAIALLQAVKERKKITMAPDDVPDDYVVAIHPETWDKIKSEYLKLPDAVSSHDGSMVLGRLPYITANHPRDSFTYCSLVYAVGEWGPHSTIGDPVYTKEYLEWLLKRRERLGELPTDPDSV
jgi:hypothetical protein